MKRFFLLGLLILIFCSLSAKAGINGDLELSLKCFYHESNKFADGRPCDLTTHTCDYRFHFCVTADDPWIIHKRCNLGHYKSYLFYQAGLLGKCAKGKVKPNIRSGLKFNIRGHSNKITVVLVIYEEDFIIVKRRDHFETLFFSVPHNIPTVSQLTDPKTVAPIVLPRTYRSFRPNKPPHVELEARLICHRNYYGPLCSVHCENTDRYTCNINGSRVCRHGWRGEDCNLKDYCVTKPCKSWAICSHNDTGFQCTCNGRVGPQCLVDSDPCFNHLCANNALCINVTDRPQCMCPTGWLGPLCEWRDPCVDSKPCRNGRCDTSVSHEGNVSIVCECESGYFGDYCDKLIFGDNSRPSNLKLSGINTAVIGLLCFMVVLLTITIFVLRKRQFLRIIGTSRNPTTASYSKKNVDDEEESVYEDPDILAYSYDCGVYSEAEIIYSDTKNEAMVADQDSVHPPLPAARQSVRYIRSAEE